MAERRNEVLAGLHRQLFQAFGNSRAGGESHQKFITKYNLNFLLLADTDGNIADAYGVKMADRNMARRVSFLIGLDGSILHVTDTPGADTHLSEMKEAVGKLKAN
jgi:thioredoxin-dependent peroxiredoxin